MVRLRSIIWYLHGGRQNVGLHTYKEMRLSPHKNFTTRGCADGCGRLVQVQGTNIRHYYTYLLARAKAYKDTRIDWVREGPTRLKRQTVDKGLLRETEAVQSQISKLLQCDVGVICSSFGMLKKSTDGYDSS